MEEGPLGAARERLEPQHRVIAEVHDGLEDGGQLVLEQDLLQGAAAREVALAPLHAHAGPGLVHQPGDQPVRHHERVLEHEAEAHHHLAGLGR